MRDYLRNCYNVTLFPRTAKMRGRKKHYGPKCIPAHDDMCKLYAGLKADKRDLMALFVQIQYLAGARLQEVTRLQYQDFSYQEPGDYYVLIKSPKTHKESF